jgi:hypothetical protein
MESLRKAIEANDTAGMERGLEQLTEAQHRAASTLYQQAAAGASPGGAAGPSPGGEPGAGSAGKGAGGSSDVIDAEVVDDGKS